MIKTKQRKVTCNCCGGTGKDTITDQQIFCDVCQKHLGTDSWDEKLVLNMRMRDKNCNSFYYHFCSWKCLVWAVQNGNFNKWASIELPMAYKDSDFLKTIKELAKIRMPRIVKKPVKKRSK